MPVLPDPGNATDESQGLQLAPVRGRFIPSRCAVCRLVDDIVASAGAINTGGVDTALDFVDNAGVSFDAVIGGLASATLEQAQLPSLFHGGVASMVFFTLSETATRAFYVRLVDALNVTVASGSVIVSFDAPGSKYFDAILTEVDGQDALTAVTVEVETGGTAAGLLTLDYLQVCVS